MWLYRGDKLFIFPNSIFMRHIDIFTHLSNISQGTVTLTAFFCQSCVFFQFFSNIIYLNWQSIFNQIKSPLCTVWMSKKQIYICKSKFIQLHIILRYTIMGNSFKKIRLSTGQQRFLKSGNDSVPIVLIKFYQWPWDLTHWQLHLILIIQMSLCPCYELLGLQTPFF